MNEQAEHLARLLMRCRTVLGNMAEENEGAIFRRWPINHEPLRADAKHLMPLIDASLSDYHELQMAAFEPKSRLGIEGKLSRLCGRLNCGPHWLDEELAEMGLKIVEK